MKITVDHIKAVKQCCRGGRQWFKSYGLNWSDFVMQGGFEEEVFDGIDDQMLRDVIEYAHKVGE